MQFCSNACPGNTQKWFGILFRPKINSTWTQLRTEDWSSTSMSDSTFFMSTVSAVVWNGSTEVDFRGEILPFRGDELQAHMVAVGNRVLLRRGDHAYVSYTKLTFLITSSFVCSVLIGTMVHRPDDDLLAIFLLASWIKEITFCPRWDCAVTVCHLSSKEKRTERRQFTPLRVLVIGPVCRSDHMPWYIVLLL